MRWLSDGGGADGAPALVTPASAAAAGAGAGGGGGGGDQPSNASFDANMVIILAALLCVLICALGLNSVIRCVLHCARRLAPPPAAAAARAVAAPAPAGLKRKALRRIPVEVYGPKSGVPATECAICLGEFADGEKVRVLPRCHHGFHVRCIDMWLATHSSCPTCRDSLLEEGGAAVAAATATGEPTGQGGIARAGAAPGQETSPLS